MPSNAKLSETWRLLKPFALPRLPLFVLVSVLGAISAFGQTSVLLLLEPVWNLVLFPGSTEFEAAEAGEPTVMERTFSGISEQAVQWGWAGTEPNDQRFAVMVAVVVVFILLSLVASAAQYSYGRLSGWLGLRMVVDLRLAITRHLMGLSLHYHGKRGLGDVLSRISADVGQTLNMVNVLFREVSQNAMLSLFYLLVSLWAAPMLTLGVLLGLPLLALPVGVLARRVRRRSTKSMSTLGASVQVLSQMFVGVRTVKAFRAEERELERYRNINEEYLGQSMKVVRASALAQAWTTLYSHIGLALLIFAVGWGAIRFGLFENGGTMMLFFMANAQMYTNMKRLTRSWTNMEASVGASERLIQMLDERHDLVEREGAKSLTSLGDGIHLEAVHYHYPESELPALDDIELHIQPGETVAFVGPSGSGKSTLLSLICRFFDPTSGTIRVGDTDLRDATLDSWTGLYSLVDQAPFLFHTTILENIRYGRTDATMEEVEAAARAAHIHDFIASLPEGYDTDVREAGDRLSGGQRQRITIARAVLKDAPLLLLDEATSALDSESEAALQEALDRLRVDRTVLVVAHRLSTIQGADRIVVLSGGRIVEVGDHASLLAKDGTYARLVRMQQLDGLPGRVAE